MNLIEEAKKVAVSGGRACEGDVDFMAKIMEKLDDKPTVVKLGANASLSLAILATRPKAKLWLMDDNREQQHWEMVALENCGLADKCSGYTGTMALLARGYKGTKIDLLVLDANSDYGNIMVTLAAWIKHLKKLGALIFIHDYDTATAPTQCPDVKKAADDYFKKRWAFKGGWSAVWKVKSEGTGS